MAKLIKKSQKQINYKVSRIAKLEQSPNKILPEAVAMGQTQRTNNGLQPLVNTKLGLS